jgi:hypothetical protein
MYQIEFLESDCRMLVVLLNSGFYKNLLKLSAILCKIL